MEITKKIFAALLIAVIIFSGRAGHCDEKMNVAVCNPWLSLLASFIGGAEVNVIPLRIWNSNGDLILNERGRILKNLEDGTKIIALDSNDASEAGINAKNQDKFTIAHLYSPFPTGVSELCDPSVIPFVAQRVLTVLSSWDSKNYPNYQRRLAEFQARMSSSVLVGQVLKELTVCDMSGSNGVLLRAAGCKIIRPDNIENWRNGNFSGLREYLNNNKANGIITLIDDDTPAALKRYLSGRSDVFRWGRPPLERDYPSFLHEQYISLWQKIITKPLPGRNVRR